jgi:D-alanyl-D-alanine carboxypeptidase
VAACGPTSGPVGTPVSSQDAASQATLDTLTSQTHTGAVAFAQTSTRRWAGASGAAVAGRPAAPDDAFDIASTKKTFVAVVVLQLVGEGRLALDDSVEKWLPGRVREGQRITIGQLLNHTSGIPPAPPGLLAPVAQQPELDSKPGTQHLYSNANYTIAELIAESVGGQPMDDLIRDRILRPLAIDRVGAGAMSPEPSHHPWLGSPEDGFGMTAASLATFFEAVLRGRLMHDRELRAMLTSVPMSGPSAIPTVSEEPAGAGLGIFRFTLVCGTAWGHAGDLPWFSNQALVSEDGTKVVVVAQNTGGWTAARAVAIALYCA